MRLFLFICLSNHSRRVIEEVSSVDLRGIVYEVEEDEQQQQHMNETIVVRKRGAKSPRKDSNHRQHGKRLERQLANEIDLLSRSKIDRCDMIEESNRYK